ncbi:MAG: hydroxymethylglutaryl-CoA lyase, partial [Proteobacteria bacterium]
MSEKSLQLVECPRDAMQGWKTFIPTETKVEYL